MELLQNVGILDIILIVILTVSVLVGLIRGAVREVLSLIGLAVAIYLAFTFSDTIAKKYISQFFEPEHISYIISFILIIICAIFALALINLLISQLLKASGLSFVDRILGMVFGVLRGGIICSILVLVLGLVPSVTAKPWWQQSTMAPVFKNIAQSSLKFLPKNIADYFDNSQIQANISNITQQVKEATKQAGIEGLDEKIDKVGEVLQDEQARQILESIATPAIEAKTGIKLESTADEAPVVKPILESYLEENPQN